MNQDPRVIVAAEPMHYRQSLAVALIVACIAVHGFDVFSIAFAAPLIARQWGVDTASLGIVLSMELIGMGVGSYLLGASADRFGRRMTIIVSLTIAATGMWLASISGDVVALALARLYTGLGIGGLLVAGSATVAECANNRRRDMAVALMVAGYPLGVAVGGLVAAALLETTGRWQAIFEAGAIASAALIVPVALYLPETIAFLCERPTSRALQRVNHILSLYGRAPVAELPPRPAAPPGAAPIRLFERGVADVTIALTLAFFMHMMTFYFLMKWIPKLVVDMGHPAAAASVVVVWANVAGTLGSLIMSLLTQRYRVWHLVIGAMILASAAVGMFGQRFESLPALSIVAAVAGFFTTGATAGFYAILVRAFPSRLRAGGTGFVIGVGRAGAAAGPIAAGLLFAAGWPLSWVAAAMACGCLVAAVAIRRMRFRLASACS